MQVVAEGMSPTQNKPRLEVVGGELDEQLLEPIVAGLAAGTGRELGAVGEHHEVLDRPAVDVDLVDPLLA